MASQSLLQKYIRMLDNFDKEHMVLDQMLTITEKVIDSNDTSIILKLDGICQHVKRALELSRELTEYDVLCELYNADFDTTDWGKHIVSVKM